MRPRSLTEGLLAVQRGTVPGRGVEQAERYELPVEGDDVDAAALPSLGLPGPDILECHGRYGQVVGLRPLDEGVPGMIVLVAGLVLPVHALLDEPPELGDLLPRLMGDVVLVGGPRAIVVSGNRE